MNWKTLKFKAFQLSSKPLIRFFFLPILKKFTFKIYLFLDCSLKTIKSLTIMAREHWMV